MTDIQKQRVHQECELEKVKFQLEVMEGLNKEIYSSTNIEAAPRDLEGLIESQIKLLEMESEYLSSMLRA